MSRPWAGMKQMMSHFYGCHFIFGQFLGGPSETSIEAESFTLFLFFGGGGRWGLAGDSASGETERRRRTQKELLYS